MTEFEDAYQRLVLLDPPLRRQWLLDHQPPSVSPNHWWLGLIERAVSDVRWQRPGWVASRPRADIALAASIIDWALEQRFPLHVAISNLAQLITIAVDAGQVAALPSNAQPDAVASRALNGFAMTREQAVIRAAGLRATPLTEVDFIQPGEDWMPAWRALTLTDGYRDYHQLLNIDRILTDLMPHVALIEDIELAAELRAWLSIRPDLDPLPALKTPQPQQMLDDTPWADYRRRHLLRRLA